jgi:hypothetical protein
MVGGDAPPIDFTDPTFQPARFWLNDWREVNMLAMEVTDATFQAARFWLN